MTPAELLIIAVPVVAFVLLQAGLKATRSTAPRVNWALRLTRLALLVLAAAGAGTYRALTIRGAGDWWGILVAAAFAVLAVVFGQSLLKTWRAGPPARRSDSAPSGTETLA